jgi:hypothetical protein
MWPCHWVYSSNVVWQHSVFIFKVRQCLHYCFSQKFKTLCSFEVLVYTQLITQRHILTDLTLQWHHCENVITYITSVYFWGGKFSVSNEILQFCYLTKDGTLSCYCVLLIRGIRHIITSCLLWMYVWHCLLLHNSTWMKCLFIHSLNLLFCLTRWLCVQGPTKTLHLQSYSNPSWLFVSV